MCSRNLSVRRTRSRSFRLRRRARRSCGTCLVVPNNFDYSIALRTNSPPQQRAASLTSFTETRALTFHPRMPHLEELPEFGRVSRLVWLGQRFYTEALKSRKV